MKIGIITMHRVPNIGSVLQAYALQNKIQNLGYEAEIIDYQFPPKKELNLIQKIKPQRLIGKLWSYLVDSPKKKLVKKFAYQYFKVSKKEYDRQLLMKECPDYDVYCTGSDQVWNPLHIGSDSSFLLDFVPDNKPMISYGSSFGTDAIDDSKVEMYKKYLVRYQSITVREESGTVLVNQLTGNKAKTVCDPTLLLEAKDWHHIAEGAKINIKGGYILVYLMRYMFDPRPHFYSIVEKVRTEMNLPVYYIGGGLSELRQKNAKTFLKVGPQDFIKLMENATIVITDSFHGTAFSTIFNRPMIGVIDGESKGGGRITTLRNKVGGNKSIVQYDSNFDFRKEELQSYTCNISKVDAFRKDSETVLAEMLAQTNVKDI